MTNRFFVILAFLALIFTGCPAPDEEGDNNGFEGTVYFTASSQIRKIDLTSGAITVIGEGHSPHVISSGEILASVRGTGLVQYSAVGANRATIISSADILTEPAMSPLSEYIAYGSGSNVYVFDLVTRTIVDSILKVDRPQWLSDRRLLLQRADTLLFFDVVTRSTSVIAKIDHGRDAAVSPDRSRIAFVEGKDLFTLNVDGSNLKIIMSGHTELRYPAWSQDGEHIVVKDGCDLKQFKVSGGMVQSFRGHFFSFTDDQCPDVAQLDWQAR